ncbi:radical SAM family heme chaperone HemW [Campylobacter vulpis]|uniref:radical SAM family heme chaperone HemW n=1 Tax=Campylobacter vulpis TaxID=1655500 RepID=UPI000C15A249|nr:radical SAM family heme chaperone HemW [Campylobacter vulpis]MBS4275280.1 coproporphyrinogen III oxidase family protein [Campylobacter vulpis]MBS4307027.1 coproporphyrinogen III oxidase family protein [Campylobacter vulpis]MBS4329592.1 coproporphyrinogen III oxidase family protein [Campylobacter vulpis]MBS4423222.1 coproporphyrinogen III oxidase family protein [Campylobacter vulpis]PHY89565.1 coproporphyrinogen III oxidase [Campylobacter vulpis]
MYFYIHIPFCESKCHYCSFTSLKKKDYEEAYFNALIKDIEFQIFHFKLAKSSIKTLFIGGGTPSVVEAKYYEKLFQVLTPFLKEKAEISCEANPNSSNFNWLKAMKELGINRLSFGVQSFNETKLKFLGRIHSQQAIFKSLENAQKAGFNNVNLDLIYDTKLDTKKMLEYELLHLEKIKPLIKHLSAYHLSIEENTAFAKRFHYKKNASNLMRFFIKGIENLGFKQYEISNFSKNKPCLHNLAYWQGQSYLAAGLSGVGFYENQRFYTHKSLQAYIKEPCFRNIEKLNLEDLNLERLFLGLRSVVGVKEKDLSSAQKVRANLLLKAKKLQFERGRYFNKNFLLSDELALFISS